MSLWQNKFPKLVATSNYVCRGNLSCLLSLCEICQDQQVGLTKVPFKTAVPVMGFWAWEILCALFKSRTSISYSPLTLLYASPSVQFSSIAQLCPTFCDSMGGSMPGLQASITSSWSLLKLVSTESVIPSTHLILCHPLLLQPSVFTSIRVFSLTQVNESVLCIRWPKYWSFSFSISPSNEHPGLISFRMDWLDLLTVQGTLKSLLQHHSSKTSILWCWAYFVGQLSHPNMTNRKTIALTGWTFVA